MTSAFGMETVAEFVEDQDTVNLLKSIGIDYIQGYYIGKLDPNPLNKGLAP